MPLVVQRHADEVGAHAPEGVEGADVGEGLHDDRRTGAGQAEPRQADRLHTAVRQDDLIQRD